MVLTQLSFSSDGPGWQEDSDELKSASYMTVLEMSQGSEVPNWCWCR